jgi:hypothetical protein
MMHTSHEQMVDAPKKEHARPSWMNQYADFGWQTMYSIDGLAGRVYMKEVTLVIFDQAIVHDY